MHVGRRDDFNPMRETRFQDVRFYTRALAADEVARLPYEDVAGEIVARQPDGKKWTTEEKFVVVDRFYLGSKDAETTDLAAAVAVQPDGSYAVSGQTTGDGHGPWVVALGPDDSILMPSTLAHQTGFLVGIVLPLAAGMKVVYQDVWEAETFCRLADDAIDCGDDPNVAMQQLRCRLNAIYDGRPDAFEADRAAAQLAGLGRGN